MLWWGDNVVEDIKVAHRLFFKKNIFNIFMWNSGSGWKGEYLYEIAIAIEWQILRFTFSLVFFSPFLHKDNFFLKEIWKGAFNVDKAHGY